MKGRTIQRNLYLIRTILAGVKDNEQAAVINLDQFMAFECVDYRYLAAVLKPHDSKPTSVSGLAVSVGSSGLATVTATLSFGVGACASRAEERGEQSGPMSNCCS